MGRPFTPAERAALAASAAERSMAILRVAASEKTWRVVRDVLDKIWGVIEGDEQVDAERWMRDIERLPEARATRPDRKSFFAMEALETTVAAVAEVHPGDPMAGRYSEVAAGIMSAYDGLARQLESKRPRVVDPRNPPPPGPWESAERRRQDEDRELLRGAPDLRQATARLRIRSQSDAAQMQIEIGQLLAGYR